MSIALRGFLNTARSQKGSASYIAATFPTALTPGTFFSGTSAENNADRDQKGRHVAPRGSSRNGAAKLGEYQVIEIRDLLAQGLSQRGIAARYGVQQATVWRIATGKGWKHVPERATHEHPEAS